MIGVIFLVLILLVAAWAFHQFVPHPFGLIAAVICGLLALYVLVTAVIGDNGELRGSLALSFLGLKLRR